MDNSFGMDHLQISKLSDTSVDLQCLIDLLIFHLILGKSFFRCFQNNISICRVKPVMLVSFL